MVSIEQIQKLEQKVHAAVSRIHSLDQENQTLRSQLAEYEHRLGELQKLVDAFKSDQAEIEAGIVSVLRHLDQLEDRVSEPESTPPSPAAASTAAEPPTDQQPAPAVEVEAQEPQPEPAEEEEEEDEADEEPELDIF